jgi:hypothetical protein
MQALNVNPVTRALHHLHEQGTRATVIWREQGEDLGTFCEVPDIDDVTVTLWSYDHGALIHLWLGQVKLVAQLDGDEVIGNLAVAS